jgi:hypothetical protein
VDLFWEQMRWLFSSDNLEFRSEGTQLSPNLIWSSRQRAAALRLESQGAFSFVDRGLLPSNTIYDSFAIVDTGPMAHVHVLQENLPVPPEITHPRRKLTFRLGRSVTCCSVAAAGHYALSWQPLS